MFKLVFLLLISSVLAENVDYLDTLDDHFDFNAVSSVELKNIMKCLIDEGPCTDVYYSWKRHYPGAVIDACGRCNVHQKRVVGVLLNRIKKELPDYYKAWRNLNDPKGIYYDKFEAGVFGN